jgi:hypothetical protein
MNADSLRPGDRELRPLSGESVTPSAFGSDEHECDAERGASP